MQIFSLKGTIHKTDGISSSRGAVVVLGFFDGVHRGHAELIKKAVSFASEANAPVCVWTFFSLPKAERVLTTVDEKLDCLSSLGVDYAAVEDFSSVCELSPDAFFDSYLNKTFAPAAVFCGFNFRYGKDAAGDADSLRRRSEEYGIPCFVLPPFEIDSAPVSSSAIRKMISEGDAEKASNLLLRPYSVTSPVLHGHEIGRGIGFPTINQIIPPDKITPAHGVYISLVKADGTVYKGISNIGSRPTVNRDGCDVTLETHIFDYSGNAYGKTVTVSLLRMLRPEMRFPSREALSEQIKKDVTDAQNYFLRFVF